MASKFVPWVSCICNESFLGSTSPRPHYPSMPTYPKGLSPAGGGAELKAVFAVAGMTCSACAGSVEKAVKRLHGIREAAVDVLNNKALVLYYPNFVTVSPTFIFHVYIYIHIQKNIYVYI